MNICEPGASTTRPSLRYLSAARALVPTEVASVLLMHVCFLLEVYFF